MGQEPESGYQIFNVSGKIDNTASLQFQDWESQSVTDATADVGD